MKSPSNAFVLHEFDKVAAKQKTLSENQINLIIKHHPVLKKSRRLRLLFIWLALEGHRKDKDTDAILLSYQLLTLFMGLTKGNCNTEELLREFKEKIAPDFEWRDYWYQGQKCRQVITSGISNIAFEYLNEGDKRMYVEDLTYFSDEKLLQVCDTLRNTAKKFHYPYSDQRKLANYLHNLPVELFSLPLQLNFNAAYEMAMEREDRKQAVALLFQIRDMPLPFYFSSRNENSLCPRIFSPSIPMLPTVIRKVLYPHWIDLDLKNCQLAIASGIFKIDRLQDYLYDGGNIWEDLLNYMSIPEGRRGETKKVFKQGVYSLVYGMDLSVVERNITNGLENLSIEKSVRFLDFPLLKVTAERLQTVKNEIRKTKKAQGAYGEMKFDSKTMDIDSFLSCLIQTYELALIVPCYNLVINNLRRNSSTESLIINHQHDGFSIMLHHEAEKEKAIQSYRNAVRRKSEELGIITSLVG